MSIPDLKETKDFIERNINSCLTSEQLQMCREMVDLFVDEVRFKNWGIVVTQDQVLETKTELFASIEDRATLIVSDNVEIKFTVQHQKLN